MPYERTRAEGLKVVKELLVDMEVDVKEWAGLPFNAETFDLIHGTMYAMMYVLAEIVRDELMRQEKNDG